MSNINVTNVNKQQVNTNRSGSAILAQIKANNALDGKTENFSNVKPYDPTQGTLYTLSGGGKFRTKDKNPEFIAAQLEQPRFKNCQFLVQLKKGGSKKGKLYKCTKKNGKICSVVEHY